MVNLLSIRVVLFLGIFVLSLHAEYVRWFLDYEKAHQEALKQNKSLMVLLLIKSDDTLVEKLFINQNYVPSINENYITVVVKKDQEGSYPIELLYTLEYPTLFLLDKHELYSCEALRGEVNPERLNAYLNRCD